MKYLNEKNFDNMGIEWNETIDVIEKAVKIKKVNDYAQPVKPYLRYDDPINRIIAMPAYLGGEVESAGIKWIASFPNNIKVGKKRANSVVVLNDAKSGEVVGIINTSKLSVIRTASVSGLMIKKFMEARELKNITVGIIGWGPIGRHHFLMCKSLFNDNIAKFKIYDKRDVVDIEDEIFEKDDRIVCCKSWEEAYEDADIFMTCTVSDSPYIDKEPKKGALLLNVSLRDYKVESFEYVKQHIIVDDWEEVCRENTDIEHFHIKKGLEEKDVSSIEKVVCDDLFDQIDANEVTMFNPMGLAIFDIAIGKYYIDKSEKEGQFIEV